VRNAEERSTRRATESHRRDRRDPRDRRLADQHRRPSEHHGRRGLDSAQHHEETTGRGRQRFTRRPWGKRTIVLQLDVRSSIAVTLVS